MNMPLVGTMLLFILAGCDLPGKPKRDELFQPPDQVASFDVLYRTNCAACHGVDGKSAPAPPLNDPLYLALGDYLL